MSQKPTYEELLQRVKALEEEKKAWLKNSAIEEIKPAKNHENSSGNSDGLGSIINVEKLQLIMDDFHQLTGMATAILDTNGTVIGADGWQDICTKFHRIHPKTAQNCTESDLFLAKNITPGKYIKYQCKNGLWDVVTPLYIDGKHLGNIYTGQFFYDTDNVDEKQFIRQAEAYGFDKDAYLDALHRVPRYTTDVIDRLMGFLVKFTSYISNVGHSNLKLKMEINERKQAEGLLQQSQSQLSAAMKMAQAGHWEYDVTSDTFTFNDHFYRIFRTTAEEMGGYQMDSSEYIRRFVHPDDAHLVANEVQKVIKATDPEYSALIEHRIFYSDGETGYIEVRFFATKDNHGRTIKTFGVNQDITSRKRMEQAARENEARLRTLLKTIPDLIWLKDENGVYLECNKTFELYFGEKEGDIVGKTDYDFLDQTLADAFRKNDRRAIEAGKPCSNEEWITLADDGSHVLLDTIKTPMFDYEGNLIGVLGVGRDITERQQASEERVKLQNQLQQAQKLESVGRLAGGVAHDFNNMLSVIIGHAEVSLAQMDRNDPLFAAIKAIRSAAGRSADITRQLLTFARKQAVTPQVLDLNETVEGMLKMLERLIGEDIDIAWLPGEGVWPVKMDASQIDQMLANLCVNARDAIDGHGRIAIETSNLTLEETYCARHPGAAIGDYVVLTVSDDGHGMDKETLEKIFEPFFTTKTIGKGTGLGLAMIYGITKQNNGFINVYSEPGRGTTFKIYLPRHAADIAGPPIKSRITKELVKGKETILLVEDDPAILDIAKTLLKHLGYLVLAVLTPGEAFREAKEHSGRIDLLMTDVIMPEMNGRELAKKLTSIFPKLNLLFMSGYTADVIAHHGVLDEGINFLQKPFSLQTLAESVRKALDGEC